MMLVFPWNRRLFGAGLSHQGQRDAIYAGSRNHYGKSVSSAARLVPAPKMPKEKVLLLPQANRSATHAVEYLHRRGIDYELIDFSIQTGRLYESYPYHNVVFVGMDADGKPRYANQRGIGSDFIGDANGSDKHYSFGIPAAAASDTLHLFESAVDLLSYGTMQKLDGKDWRSENLLSLAGVYKPKAKIEESSLPAALVRYLAEHPHICRVVLRLDNDATGRIAAETIKTLLPRKYAVTVDIQPPPQGKDLKNVSLTFLGIHPTAPAGQRLQRLPMYAAGSANYQARRKEQRTVSDLISSGRRIRHYRMLWGMTQKALGIAAGFPPETADIRIAQYESGARTPKYALLCTLAEALGVSPSALDIPCIKSREALNQLLLALADEYGLTITITENDERSICNGK